MENDQFFRIGHISRVHGNDGKVYVKLDVDDGSTYENLESVFLELENKPVPFFIESFRWTPNGPLIKFEDFIDREDAMRYLGTSLLLPIEELKPLEKGKFYFHELISCELIDSNSGTIGEIELIYDQTSQILLGVNHKGKEVLIPLVDEYNPVFDRESKTLKMDLPEGLIDLN